MHYALCDLDLTFIVSHLVSVLSCLVIWNYKFRGLIRSLDTWPQISFHCNTFIIGSYCVQRNTENKILNWAMKSKNCQWSY